MQFRLTPRDAYRSGRLTGQLVANHQRIIHTAAYNVFLDSLLVYEIQVCEMMRIRKRPKLTRWVVGLDEI